MDFLGGEQSFVMPKPSLPVLIILALGVLTVRLAYCNYSVHGP